MTFHIFPLSVLLFFLFWAVVAVASATLLGVTLLLISTWTTIYMHRFNARVFTPISFVDSSTPLLATRTHLHQKRKCLSLECMCRSSLRRSKGFPSIFRIVFPGLAFLRRSRFACTHVRVPKAERFLSSVRYFTELSTSSDGVKEERVHSPSSKYIIPPDLNHLQPAPGKLYSILSERLAAARQEFYERTKGGTSPSFGKRERKEEKDEEVSRSSDGRDDSTSHLISSLHPIPSSFSSYAPSPFSAFPLSDIRNVSVVAHVDHGKTTLTDAILRWSGLLPSESAVGTFTDRLPVEKERGITIKAQTCSILLRRQNHDRNSDNSDNVKSKPSVSVAIPNGIRDTPASAESAEWKYYLINFVDTPGHADFQYEVSRSLHATEGALLLVDANQGVEAQTLAQFYSVLEREGQIVPVLSKMDAVSSDDRVDKTLTEMGDSMGMLGLEEVLLTSAKQKQGIEAVFQAIVDRIPPPTGKVGYSDWTQLPLMHPSSPQRQAAEQQMVPLRALVFDCWTAESGGMIEKPVAPVSTVSNGSPSPTTGSLDPLRASAGVRWSSSSTAPSVLSERGRTGGGIYCLIRVVDGTLSSGTSLVLFHHPHLRPKVEEVGVIHPTLHPLPALTAGMVGYVLVKGVQKEDVRVGETFCTMISSRYVLASREESKENESEARNNALQATVESASMESGLQEKERSLASAPSISKSSTEGTTTGMARTRPPSRITIYPIPGFRRTHPVVFAGLFPDDDNYIGALRESVSMLCLNDPAVSVENIQCQALGPGLQLGFLGLLHLQVFIDRLLQEFGMPVLVTPPQVQYMYVGVNEDPTNTALHKPLTVETWLWPHEGVGAYLEPVVHATVVTPISCFDGIHQAALTSFRGVEEDVKGLDDGRMAVRYRMPLGDLARGFFTIVKSVSHGYASLDYDQPHYVEASVVKVDIVINKARIGALSFICPEHEAVAKSKKVLQSLKENLSRCSVDLPIQALIGQKVVARETIKAYRKDVTAKIHAGDISRKLKKWNDQKKGKKRMAKRTVGTVTLDQAVLSAAMGATMLGG